MPVKGAGAGTRAGRFVLARTHTHTHTRTLTTGVHTQKGSERADEISDLSALVTTHVRRAAAAAAACLVSLLTPLTTSVPLGLHKSVGQFGAWPLA